MTSRKKKQKISEKIIPSDARHPQINAAGMKTLHDASHKKVNTAHQQIITFITGEAIRVIKSYKSDPAK